MLIAITANNKKIVSTPFVYLECSLKHIVQTNSKTIIATPTITPATIPPMIAPDKLSSL